jgi:RHS repeat-associated protein
MTALEYGYVPPGMPPQQAAMLYNTLPNNVKMPNLLEPGSPEWTARMANEPMDPETGLPFNFKEHQIQAANQQMLERYMRERNGPIYIPPLHRDHNNVPQVIMANSVSTVNNRLGAVSKDHQGSIREMVDASGNIVAEYSYDPYGRQTKISGSGPSADFGYAGYYVHQPSGLLLTQTRAYSPTLGRFINRDPMGERGGTNLFAYVGNSPTNWIDPRGTQGTILLPGTGTIVEPGVGIEPYIPGGSPTPYPWWSGEMPTPWLIPPGQQPIRWVVNPDRVKCFLDAEREYEDCISRVKKNADERKKNPNWKCPDHPELPKTEKECEDEYEKEKARCRQLPTQIPVWEM